LLAVGRGTGVQDLSGPIEGFGFGDRERDPQLARQQTVTWSRATPVVGYQTTVLVDNKSQIVLENYGPQSLLGCRHARAHPLLAGVDSILKCAFRYKQRTALGGD